MRMRIRQFGATAWLAIPVISWLLTGAASGEPSRPLWGDTHLHSCNSFDAFLNRNMSADPATAYRYAKGLPVIHPYHFFTASAAYSESWRR